MTVEEYDAKAGIRRTISDINLALKELETTKTREGLSQFTFNGIGPITRFSCVGTIGYGVNDPVIIKEFKELLIRRRQELLDEFIQ
jgi:hypothetical protein